MNAIELVLVHFNFDTKMSVNGFINTLIKKYGACTVVNDKIRYVNETVSSRKETASNTIV